MRRAGEREREERARERGSGRESDWERGCDKVRLCACVKDERRHEQTLGFFVIKYKK
jgi:hypothetical protein